MYLENTLCLSRGFFGAQNKCFERILEKYIGADSNLEGPEL